jgi:hypothetical protein
MLAGAVPATNYASCRNSQGWNGLGSSDHLTPDRSVNEIKINATGDADVISASNGSLSVNVPIKITHLACKGVAHGRRHVKVLDYSGR